MARKSRRRKPNGIYSKIAGVTFQNRDGRSRQEVVHSLRCRQLLILRREPGNPHDAEAIRVLTQDGTQVGYIGADLADQLAGSMDAGDEYHAVVCDLTGGDQQSLGVNILILAGAPGAVPLMAAPARSYGSRAARRSQSSGCRDAGWALALTFLILVGIVALVISFATSTGNSPPGIAPPQRGEASPKPTPPPVETVPAVEPPAPATSPDPAQPPW